MNRAASLVNHWKSLKKVLPQSQGHFRSLRVPGCAMPQLVRSVSLLEDR